MENPSAGEHNCPFACKTRYCRKIQTQSSFHFHIFSSLSDSPQFLLPVWRVASVKRQRRMTWHTPKKRAPEKTRISFIHMGNAHAPLSISWGIYLTWFVVRAPNKHRIFSLWKFVAIFHRSLKIHARLIIERSDCWALWCHFNLIDEERVCLLFHPTTAHFPHSPCRMWKTVFAHHKPLNEIISTVKNYSKSYTTFIKQCKQQLKNLSTGCKN